MTAFTHISRITILRLLVDSEVSNSSKSENQLLNKTEKSNLFFEHSKTEKKKKRCSKKKK